MHRGILLLVLAAASCSRPPSATQAYSEAWVAYRQGKLKKAQDIVDAALKNHGTDPQAALEPVRLLQIEILTQRGQARKAQGLLADLPDPHDPLLHLRWMVDRADVASKVQQGSAAVALLDEVDRTAGSNSSSDPVIKGRLLRGSLLAREKRFDEADRVLEEALARSVAAGDSFNQAAALLNLCFSKSNNQRYDESIRYGLPSLEAAGKINAGLLTSLVNNNLGITYTILRDLDRAEQHLRQAIAQLREVDDQRNLASAFGNLGNLYLLSHQGPRAAQEIEQAVKIAESVDATLDASRWAGRLSLAFIEQQKWDEAEFWNRHAITLNETLKFPDNQLYLKMNAAAIANGRGKRAEAERLYRDVILASSGDLYLAWNGHFRLGSLLADADRLSDASREYEEGLKVLEKISSGIMREDYRITYEDSLTEFFKAYVDLLVKQGHPDQALQVAESSRARLLTEKLGVPKVARDEVKPEEFKRVAGSSGAVLLSYWLAPKRSFVWVVTSRNIHVTILPAQPEIEELVQAYRKGLEEEQRDPIEEGMPQADRLSKMLLGPLQADLAGVKRVVVVPDGALHSLNMETLPEPGTGRYWIEDAELSIAPSLSLLAETQPKSRTKGSLLLMGAPESAGPEYPKLAGAKSEIEAIQRGFPGQEKVVRIESAATPQAFLGSMPERFSMIHFAAHAETNSQRPLESAIILSKSGEKFKLYAHDITGLKLSADLVTISACRSAGVRTYGGEGLVGFAWAFLRSGAHSVIAGLWDVGDAASSRLIQKLYEKLGSGARPADALRQAKLDLLRSKVYRKPYQWAPYQTYIR